MDFIFHKHCINLDEENIDKLLNEYRYSLIDGKYGLHKYFQYGGKNEKYLDDPSSYLLDSKNNCIGIYLKNNLLKKFIDGMDNDLLKIVNFKFYLYVSRLKDKDIILKIAKIFPNPIFYFLIKNKRKNIIKFLIKNDDVKINFNDPSYSTILNLSIKYNRIDIFKELIHYFRVDEPYNLLDKRSLNYAIDYGNIDIIKITISKAKNDNINLNLIDNRGNTFLHNFLFLEREIILNLLDELVYLLDTNLNQSNYHGLTCAHILFDMKYFMIDKVFSKLKNKKIDFGKKNYLNENIFSLSEKFNNKEKNKFMLLRKNFKMTINTIPFTFNMNNITFEYGLFRSNLFDYMIYLDYLIKKYNVYVLTNKKIYDYDFNYFRFYDEDTILRNDFKVYKNHFPKFFDHTIRWLNKDKFYIADNYFKLENIHDQIYLIKITHIGNNLKHANVLIYDNKYKTAYRFEPYGISDLGNDGKELDNKLKEMLENNFGKIKYFDPDSFLYGLNFQLINGEDQEYMSAFGDPKGYCLAWSLFFVEFYIQNKDESKIFIHKMKSFMNRDILVSKFKKMNYKSINYYLDFIRSYGNHLNKVKIDKYHYLGINDNKYLNSMTDDMIDKIKTYFNEEY
jgi:hypothetical protein